MLQASDWPVLGRWMFASGPRLAHIREVVGASGPRLARIREVVGASGPRLARIREVDVCFRPQIGPY